MMEIRPIAHIRTAFAEKFGVPRQSGLAKHLRGRIIFEREFRNLDALRGLEGFSHLWLIWEFSANRSMNQHKTEHSLGLSCVKIAGIELDTPDGPVIEVAGADLMDGTPIYDIKPYIRYADARPEAVCGYVDTLQERSLKVVLPKELSEKIEEKTIIPSLIETLQLDPRPSYHDDPEREYGMSFAGYNIRFTVSEDILTVRSVTQHS